MELGIRGIKGRTYLEQAMRQSLLVGERLAEVDGAAALVDVSWVWEPVGGSGVGVWLGGGEGVGWG